MTQTENNDMNNVAMEDWNALAEALDAKHYLIQGQNPVSGKAINFCRPYGGGEEILWDKAAVTRNLSKLMRKNDEGYNIYCMPVSHGIAYLLVDDVNSEDKRQALESLELGQPRVVIESSQNNRQYIYAARISELDKYQHNDARTAANRIVREINSRAGDPNISGIYHQFRIPGFRNKKPGRDNFICRLIEVSHETYSAKIEVMAQELLMNTGKRSSWSNSTYAGNTKRVISAGCERNYEDCPSASWQPYESRTENAYRRNYNRARGLAKHAGWAPDPSTWDIKAATEMLRSGYDPEEIIKAIKDKSPKLAQRHKDVERYAETTVLRAYKGYLREVLANLDER